MKQSQIVITYDYYTLDQAREIIKAENKQRAERITRQKIRKKQKILYMLIQKFFGILLLACAAIVYFMPDPDKTTLLFFVPFGLFLVFTKEKVMMF